MQGLQPLSPCQAEQNFVLVGTSDLSKFSPALQLSLSLTALPTLLFLLPFVLISCVTYWLPFNVLRFVFFEFFVLVWCFALVFGTGSYYVAPAGLELAI